MAVRRVVTVLAAVALSLSVTAVVAATPASAVANGKAAAAGQYQFAVRLTMTHIPRSDGTFYNSACSGALISPTWIITAGHCFHDINRNPVSGPVPYATTATLGTNDLSVSQGESRSVVTVRQSSSTDVALAQLSAPVIDVTPLAISRAKPALGSVVTLAGWGATSDVNAVPSTKLNTGQMKIKTVKTSYVYVVGYSPSSSTSACLYDSGAPYFLTPSSAAPQLVSVESDGPACPHTTPETTARVDNIASWISSVVAAGPTPSSSRFRTR
ncbi:MAG: esterase [Pseudonocardiales bacterium]|nr:esterase [Pseudonocardiales bacterium]